MHKRALSLALIVALIASGVTIYGWVQVAKLTAHIGHRANVSASVQHKQLVAGSCLIAVIDDIHQLFVLPVTPQEKRQQAHESEATRRLIRKLTHDAGRFQQVADTLPRPRRCN